MNDALTNTMSQPFTPQSPTENRHKAWTSAEEQALAVLNEYRQRNPNKIVRCDCTKAGANKGRYYLHSPAMKELGKREEFILFTDGKPPNNKFDVTMAKLVDIQETLADALNRIDAVVIQVKELNEKINPV